MIISDNTNPACDEPLYVNHIFFFFFAADHDIATRLFLSSAQEMLLVALKPFTRYELAVQSNGVDVVGPFSGTVEESTLSDREC